MLLSLLMIAGSGTKHAMDGTTVQAALDRLKPAYHLLTPTSTTKGPFDPNGAVYANGLYHLFYIYSHGWGHATSKDMVRWERLPDALVPEKEDAIYSGNLFFSDKGATIAYHVYPHGNGYAYSDDGLTTWTKDERNPLYTSEGDVSAWDPFVWREGDTYYGIFGGVTAYLLKGPTHDSMRLSGRFIELDKWSEADEDYSCPDFFPLGDKWVFATMSHSRGTRLFLGEWDGQHFRPENMLRLNWQGGGFVAPETLLTPDGRRVLFGWILDPRSKEFEGVISLPREVFLLEDGSLGVKPIDELKTLRKEELEGDIFGSHLEIEAEFEPTDQPVGIVVHRSEDGREQTRIIYDGRSLRIDSEKSSLDKTTLPRRWGFVGDQFAKKLNPRERVREQVAPLELGNETLKLRVFVDGSVLEVFVNDRLSLTHRVFPTLQDAMGVEAVGVPKRLVAYSLSL